jgi:hypothetical protein
MPRTLALLLLALAVAAPAQAQAPPPWLAAFRDYCIPYVQGRSRAAVEALARKAGHAIIPDERRLEFETPAGVISLSQVAERRSCEVRPRGIGYPTLQRDLGAWLPTAPDGPFVRQREPGPNEEGSRFVDWKGPRYGIQINEEIADDDSGIYLFVEAATPS